MKLARLQKNLSLICVALSVAFPLSGWASFAEGEEAYLKQDYYGAFLKFVPLSKQGDAGAQAMIGRIYAQGTGAPRDLRTAAISYEQAAIKGHAVAQYQVAKMYANGAGVKQDPARAAEWMEKSAEQGVLWALFEMGQMCKDGKGVPQSNVQALKWMNLAAASKETPATTETIRLAKAAASELSASMAPDQIDESRKLVMQWNKVKRVRDEQWQKTIFAPIETRPPEPRPNDKRDDKGELITPLSKDYFPQAR